MPTKILSWNMYYGNLSYNDTTPVSRFNYITALAAEKDVDIVFLQEHPGISSQYTDVNGCLIGVNIPDNYNYHLFQEMDSGITNRYSQSNRSYAVIIKDGYDLKMSYFYQDAFVNDPQLSSYMRCPIKTEVTTPDQTSYNFFHWHNEVNYMSQYAMSIFTGLRLLPNTVLVGDLNLTANQINQEPFFNNWNDVVVDNADVHGVDHIMSELNCNPILGEFLNFRSDANHYPIAAEIT